MGVLKLRCVPSPFFWLLDGSAKMISSEIVNHVPIYIVIFRLRRNRDKVTACLYSFQHSGAQLAGPEVLLNHK